MKVRRFLNFRIPPVAKNKKLLRRAVDQSPVSKAYQALNGYYHNDLHMMRLASDKGDKALFDALSSRLQGIEEPANNKTIQQLFDEWKPLYIQTPVEEQAWLQYLNDVEPDLYNRLYGEEDKRFDDSRKSASDVQIESADTKSVE